MTPEEWAEYKANLSKQQTIQVPKYEELNPNDVVFTPRNIAEKICKSFPIEGKVLEPCKGKGVFLEFLPIDTDWCEITEGRNFYDYNKKVDWIVGNPPYSKFNEFLQHSFELADNIVFIIPFAKVFKSMGTMNLVHQYGNIVSIHFLSASRCGFPFGFPCGIFWFKRGYKGQTMIRSFDSQ